MRTCGLLWKDKAQGATSDEEDDEEEGSPESRGLGSRDEDRVFGLAGRHVLMPTKQHSCGMGARVPWNVPPLLGRGQILPTTAGVLRKVEIGVVLRVAVCSQVSGSWQACFSLDYKLAVLAVMQPWFGTTLRFHGEATVQGFRENQRQSPVVSWAGSGCHRRFGLPSGVELKGTSWWASMVYGPRTNVELWGLAVRLTESEDLVERKKG